MSENISNAAVGPLGIPASALGLAALGARGISPNSLGSIAGLMGVPALAAAPFSLTNMAGQAIGAYGNSLIAGQQFDPVDLQAIANTPMAQMFPMSAFGGFGRGSDAAPAIGASSPGFGLSSASVGTPFSMPAMGPTNRTDDAVAAAVDTAAAQAALDAAAASGVGVAPGVPGEAGPPGDSGEGEGGFALGGRIPGKPSAIDSLMIKAAPGEFVVNAPTAAHHLGMLERLNRGR